MKATTLALRATMGLWVVSLACSACAVEGMPEEEAELEEVLKGIPRGMDPIIFVHGCTPPEATDQMAAGLFDQMKQYARDQAGYPDSFLVSFVNNGPQCQSSIAFANQLNTLIDQTRAATGRGKVDIVAHSMGALAARWYISRLSGAGFVEDLVTIAGANHGGAGAAPGVTLQAAFGFPAYEGMQEMFPPYACQGQASGPPTADVQYDLNGCLTLTGRTVSRDETPGNVSYFSIRNTLDELVQPVESACLNQARQNDCSSPVNFQVTVPPGPGPCGPPGTICMGHVAMLWDPVVMQQTIARTSD